MYPPRLRAFSLSISLFLHAALSAMMMKHLESLRYIEIAIGNFTRAPKFRRRQRERERADSARGSN